LDIRQLFVVQCTKDVFRDSFHAMDQANGLWMIHDSTTRILGTYSHHWHVEGRIWHAFGWIHDLGVVYETNKVHSHRNDEVHQHHLFMPVFPWIGYSHDGFGFPCVYPYSMDRHELHTNKRSYTLVQV
jgi:hypothetical protein